MKRKSLEGNACTIARSLDLIGDWWSLLIIRDALAGRRRFGEFQKSLGLAKNILALRLKSMVENGIMETVPASDGSAYQEYLLTGKGRALLPVLIALGQWGAEFLFECGEHGAIWLDTKKKKPLRKLELRSEEGRLLQLEDIHISSDTIALNLAK